MAARKKGPKKAQERNLTRELSALLAKVLRPSLEERAKQPSVAAALTAQFEAERKANRTAEKRDEWVERTLEQVGVGWILSCVFVRTLEDRGYLTHARLAGEGAGDSEHLFFDQFPSLTQRDYLLAVFRELSHVPGGEEVLGPKHNPAWRLSPSTEAVRELITFLRETDAEGRLQWTFGGDDTRFLGDLYEQISAAVRERHALRQTPDFIEAFILNLTLDPAIAEYGLEDVRLLDPTCGSGHFLLGAFKRLFEARQRKAPGKPVKEHALAALGQVYGVDVNPYAAAIARFRLVLAYLRAAEIDKLKNAPRLPSNVVVADSLAFFAKDQTLHFAGSVEDGALWGGEYFQLEDAREATRLFSRKYHAIVGNPPYITCKDPNLRELYRDAYESAAGKYALSAPFTERFFQLAVDGGFVGMINANSFMKREFGTALVEKVLPNVELTRVIDTAGAHIPHHGTPTVLLFGRNRTPLSDKVSAVLGKRDEPGTPVDPVQGQVWSSIAHHFREIGFENEYISTAEIPRGTLSRHPWSLGGGGAAELKQVLDSRGVRRLGDISVIGVGGMSNADDVFIADLGSWSRYGMPSNLVRQLVVGEDIRNWIHNPSVEVFFPYDQALSSLPLPRAAEILLWPYRTSLWARATFGGGTYRSDGRTWWQWHQVTADRYRTPLSIAFAEVATHNHFVLDRGGNVFKQTAPIIKLSDEATEDEHLALAAYLNSSTACFWLKQTCFNKGGSGIGRGVQDEAWEARYAFDGSKLNEIPLPALDGLEDFGRRLTALATEAQVALQRGDLAAYESTVGAMVAAQEQLDFEVYARFSLIGRSPLIPDLVQPGSRSFELALTASGKETTWFQRNGYPTPSRGDASTYCATGPEVTLIEQPEYKRRWILKKATDVRDGIHAGAYLADVEAQLLSYARPSSLAAIRRFVTSRQGDPEGALGNPSQLVHEASVPFLAGLRYSDSGLAKRAEWEKVWALQRREDTGEKLDIPVPPKYDSKDFRDPIYWRLRGKLDVPKERFISYPGAEKDDDKSPLYGWAGWDHLQQATALAGLYHERKAEDGWLPERLGPLLAGLLELLPWLKQWHNDPTDDLGGEGAGDWYERYIEAEARSLGKSLDDLRAWRPPKGGRGRKK